MTTVQTRLVLALSIIVLVITVFSANVRSAHAASPLSVVYLDPVRSGDSSFQSPGTSFTVNVRLNLTGGTVMNTFDVRLNYSSPFLVVKADRIDSSGNIFASPYSALTVHSCIDDVSGITGGCETGTTPDTTGQVHFSQTLLGSTITGPVSRGLLFSITFHTVGNGTSFFAFDRANLVDPVGSDPSFPNPHLVMPFKLGGVFANVGLVSFFNYEPTDSLALLPGRQIFFDATASFFANNTATPITSYSWDFGDSTTGTGSTINHVFVQPGTYSVSLTVAITGSQKVFTQKVVIVPALGSIILAFRGTTDLVKVELFNSSSTTSFTNKTASGTVGFDGLVPGQYTVRITGPTIHDYSKVETIQAGVLTPDTLYLTAIPPPPDYRILIFFGSLSVGLGLFLVLMVLKRRRLRAGWKTTVAVPKKAPR